MTLPCLLLQKPSRNRETKDYSKELEYRLKLRKKSPYSELFWSTFFPDFPRIRMSVKEARAI